MDNNVLKAVAVADTSQTKRELAATYEVTITTACAHLDQIAR